MPSNLSRLKHGCTLYIAIVFLFQLRLSLTSPESKLEQYFSKYPQNSLFLHLATPEPSTNAKFNTTLKRPHAFFRKENYKRLMNKERGQSKRNEPTNGLFQQTDDYLDDLFVCNQMQLDYILFEKVNFGVIDIIMTQHIVNELFKQQVAALEGFLAVTFPMDWRNADSIENFIRKYNYFSNTIRQRDDIILCEIMSILMIMRNNDLLQLNTLLLPYEAYPLKIHEYDCNSQLLKFANSVDLSEFNDYENVPILRILEENYRQVLECFYFTYEKIAAFNEKYSYISSIKDLEIKLMTLLLKSQVVLPYKMSFLGETWQTLLLKLS